MCFLSQVASPPLIDACDSLSVRLYVGRAGFDGRGLDLSLDQRGKSFVQRRNKYISVMRRKTEVTILIAPTFHHPSAFAFAPIRPLVYAVLSTITIRTYHPTASLECLRAINDWTWAKGRASRAFGIWYLM